MEKLFSADTYNIPYNSLSYTFFTKEKVHRSIFYISSTTSFFFVFIFSLIDFFDEFYIPGQACMDTVVNPPQPGEPSYETWKAEVDTTIASLKRSGIYLPVAKAMLLDLALHSI